MKKIFLVLTILMFMITGSASALTIQGELWAPADLSAFDPTNVPGVAANATFTVNKLDFDSRRGDTTYDTFLQGIDNNLIWSDPSWDVNGLNKDSFYTDGGGTANNIGTGTGTFFRFTGTAYFEENTTIIHDDGFWLQLTDANNIPSVYDFNTPTSPATHSIGNLAGNYDFVMHYGAWNDFPEVLIAPMSAPVPEPATMVLFGIGLLGLAGVSRKKK